MKSYIVLSLFVTLCAGGAIPNMPLDNSNYVEGKSRYIWMPDGDNVPHLVDLQAATTASQPRNGEDNQYWLYTRQNPQSHQLLIPNDVASVRNSNFNASLPIKVIVHGWISSGTSEINPMIRDAYLQIGDFNIIVVDWSGAAGGIYTSAVLAVPSVGQHLGNFLNWLISDFGGNFRNMHLVGFSLGGHVIGNAGRVVGGRIARLTALDPAGPQWSGNRFSLNRHDGIYVETIHTDGGLLGIFDPISDADFYPNGGRDPQPGCPSSPCSHARAYELFAASVVHNHLFGRHCRDITEARHNRCRGTMHQMGNSHLRKRGYGLFALSTGAEWPY
ncbi:unnamed protein product [Leptosia nina]|uniref:Lipase domain-containing protein n=1 Tax=Leptosia nina TaxID=320188 RepID=A0AAV1J6A5_9NEOP